MRESTKTMGKKKGGLGMMAKGKEVWKERKRKRSV